MVLHISELTIHADGTREWAVAGELHRDDGPALTQSNGVRSWWRHGRLHRDGGPAVEHPTGMHEWWRDGQLHRDDGPAVEDPGAGIADWCIRNHRVTAEVGRRWATANPDVCATATALVVDGLHPEVALAVAEAVNA